MFRSVNRATPASTRPRTGVLPQLLLGLGLREGGHLPRQRVLDALREALALDGLEPDQVRQLGGDLVVRLVRGLGRRLGLPLAALLALHVLVVLVVLRLVRLPGAGGDEGLALDQHLVLELLRRRHEGRRAVAVQRRRQHVAQLLAHDAGHAALLLQAAVVLQRQDDRVGGGLRRKEAAISGARETEGAAWGTAKLRVPPTLKPKSWTAWMTSANLMRVVSVWPW